MADNEEQETAYAVQFIDGGEETKESKWIHRAGKAKVRYPNGDVFEGTYNENGIRHGNGIYTWNTKNIDAYADTEEPPLMQYKGSYQFGSKHGSGVFRYPNGSSYRGQFMWDKKHGVGSYTYPNGDVYSGKWKGDKRHGKGVYVVKETSSQLVGTWSNGTLTQGRWVMEDGTVFDGAFEGSTPSGKGTFTFENASVVVGEYKKNENDDDDVGASHSWTTKSTEETEIGLTFSGEKDTEAVSVASVRNITISSISADGSIVLQNSGEEIANVNGLRVDVFVKRGEDADVLASFQFKDDIDLLAKQSLRLLFGKHASNPPRSDSEATEEEDSENVPDASASTLDLIWSNADLLQNEELLRVEVGWSTLYGDRVWLARKTADGKDEHKFITAAETDEASKNEENSEDAEGEAKEDAASD